MTTTTTVFDTMLTKVVRTTSRGRMVVATNKIDRGTQLLCELPTTFVDHNLGCEINSRDQLGPSMLLAVQTIAIMEKSERVALSMKDLCVSGDGSPEAQANLHSAAFLVNQKTNGSVGLQRCREILKQLQVNCFTATNGDFSNTLGIGLYLQAAAVNHSCDPNACQSFYEDTKALSIRAIKDIQPGEEITITYIDIGKPTSWRRRELQATYGFVCMCHRCSTEDPMIENSGIRCQSSCAGCPGMYQLLEHDIYRQWNSATTTAVSNLLSVSSTTISSSSTDVKMDIPLPLPYLDVWQTHFQSLLQHPRRSGTDDGDRYGSQNSPSPTTAQNDTASLRFQCTSCQHTISGVVLAEQVAALCELVCELNRIQASQHNSATINNNNSDSNYLTQCFDLLQKLSSWMNTSTNSYAMIEIYRQHMLDELLLQQRFEQYLHVIRSVDYLIHLNSCYPYQGHPILSTQAAMVAKALLFVCTSSHDVQEAQELLVSAVEQLRIAYGSENPIVRDIQGMLSNL